MPKFDIGINGMDVGVAEGREAWAGELPPTGNYDGVLQVLSLDVITSAEAKHQGAHKLRVGVKLVNTPEGKYDGYLAWGNISLIDESRPYLNQFLLALTDGSDEQFVAIKKAMYETKPNVDERKKHITSIGRWNVNSPKGELPIKVSIKNTPFFNERTKQTTDQVRIDSYLLGEGASVPTSSGPATIVEDEEEPTQVVLDEDEIDTDESILDADEEEVNA